MTLRSRLRHKVVRRVAAAACAAGLLLALPPTAARGQPEVPPRVCPVEAPAEDFTDREAIPQAHQASADCTAFFEISRGFSDGSYGPALEVRRDQIASFVARTLGAADVELPPASAGADFTDVEADSPHRESIRRLEAAGIVEGGALGRGEDEYGPKLSTRRDQMTSLLMRAAAWAFEEDFASDEQRFDDVPADNVHSEAVNAAADNGIVVGFDEDTFGPARHTRRDQMASFVVRVLSFSTTPAEVAISDQSAERATVEEPLTVTASVFDQFRDEAEEDAAFAGPVDVTFQAEHAGGDPAAITPSESQTVETDQAGQAEFSFTAAEPGTVTVTAAIDGPGGRFAHADGDRHRVEKRVVAGPTPDERAATLTLEPGTASKVLRSDHTVTAAVADDAADPVPGATVRSERYRRRDGTHTLEAVDHADTDEDGAAALTFAGPSEPAEDVVIACVVADADLPDEPLCAEATSEGGDLTDVRVRDEAVGDDATVAWVRGSTPGTLGGTVTGPLGGVAGATVVFDDGTREEATTNLSGAYRSPSLAPAVYRVSVEGYDCLDEPRQVTVFAGEDRTGVDFLDCAPELL